MAAGPSGRVPRSLQGCRLPNLAESVAEHHPQQLPQAGRACRLLSGRSGGKRRWEAHAVPYNAPIPGSNPQSNSSVPAQAPQESVEAISSPFYTFFKFSRPHTMLGTFVSIMSVSLLAMVRSPVTVPPFSHCLVLQNNKHPVPT